MNQIETCDYTWNPITGCVRGCPVFHPERLASPLHLRKPSRIFVCSMSDLFGEGVDHNWADDVFRTICASHGRHAFYLLTKRPDRMLTWFEHAQSAHSGWFSPSTGRLDLWRVWLGVSVTCQADADERIPLLLQVPAAHRFVSCEPLLGPLDLRRYLTREWVTGPMKEPRAGTIGGGAYPTARLGPALDWVVVGAQTGPGAVPVEAEWVNDLYEQCDGQAYRDGSDSSTPMFFKRSLAKLDGLVDWLEQMP